MGKRRRPASPGAGGGPDHCGDGDAAGVDRGDSDAADLPVGRCRDVDQCYEKLRRLGQGTYGIVYQARDRRTGRLVALKKCLPHHAASDGVPLTTLRELQTLRLLGTGGGRDNIVSLLDVAVGRRSVFLVFEYCPQELGVLLDGYYDRHKRSPFEHAAAKTLTRQLLSAVAHLHAHYLIHRDIKMSNLLYKSGNLKLADFGLSRSLGRGDPAADRRLTPTVASLWYRPPELLWRGSSVAALNDGQHDGTAADVTRSSGYRDAAPPHASRPPTLVPLYDLSLDLWAVGCVHCELLLGYPPMNGRDEPEQVRRVLEFLGPPPRAWCEEHGMATAVEPATVAATGPNRRAMLTELSYLSLAGLRFARALLHYEPAARWTAAQARDCEYLTIDAPLPLSVERMPRFGDDHSARP